ncbi:hypothetical protein ACKN8S_07820 [Limosilactobacillus reuteri]|uniref:hypothetical protein n=1 Tax=Limosilactobacillus reuteri TaxID=1598 RepID=UPI0039BFB7F8
MKRTKMLYWLAFLFLLFGFLAWPSNKKVNQAQAKLDSTNKAIDKYQTQATNVSLDNNFDLQKNEQTAQQMVTEGVGLALGGIHSQDDFEHNKGKLKAELGNKLMDDLVDYSKDHDTHQYISAKNDNVTVGFSEVNNPSNAKVEISTEFERLDGTKKYILIEGHYNLKSFKFNDSNVYHLAKQPTTYSGGNN